MEVPRCLASRRAALVAVAGTIAWACSTGSAWGLDFPVANTNDAGSGSLRQAVLDANANPGEDRVTFDGSVSGTITLTGGQINITGPLEIDGPGPLALSVSGNDASRIFAIPDVADPGVTIEGLRLIDGGPVETVSDCGCGGAILNFSTKLAVENSFIESSDATWGGGIESFQGNLKVRSSAIVDNNASHDFDGGGIHVGEGRVTIKDTTVAGNTSVYEGAGLALHGERNTIKSSTIFDNEAGRHDGGITLDEGKVTITNSTIAGNVAGKFGGGIGNSAKLTIKSSTIAGNQAKNGGGLASDGPTSLINTIVADNSATAKGPDIYAETKLDHSLIEEREKLFLKGKPNGSILGKDPKLDLLDDNGGLTSTMALEEGSRAIDKGSKKAPGKDQRGYERDNKPDIGAFEFDAAP